VEPINSNNSLTRVCAATKSLREIAASGIRREKEAQAFSPTERSNTGEELLQTKDVLLLHFALQEAFPQLTEPRRGVLQQSHPLLVRLLRDHALHDRVTYCAACNGITGCRRRTLQRWANCCRLSAQERASAVTTGAGFGAGAGAGAGADADAGAGAVAEAPTDGMRKKKKKTGNCRKYECRKGT
jgi:hypothetical protein